jgi:signal transduction histidine kinase/CheY-like chemotaxis protein
VINDVTETGAMHRPNPLLPETRAELGIPLKIGRGSDSRIIGALDVQSTHPNAFSQDDVAVLNTLADQIAIAVENARSYTLVQQAISETRRRVQELSLIYQLSQSLANAPLEPQDIARIAAQAFMKEFNLPQVSISVVDLVDKEHPEQANLNLLVDLRFNPETKETYAVEINPAVDPDQNVALQDFPATAEVIRTAKPIIVQANDPAADPSERAYMQRHNLSTLVILPLVTSSVYRKEGLASGVVELEISGPPRHFHEYQINFLVTLANLTAAALENARLFQEQLQTAEQLRELDKLKSQFLANMSHELRTPLNSIIGFSRVILKGIDGPISDLQKQDLTAINSAGQHLLQLINDVLDISKIEAGKMELAFDDHVQLGDIITSAMSTAIGLTKDKPIRLEREVEVDLPLVRADPTRIRQVLINFLSNAAKFCDEGTITVKSYSHSRPHGEREVVVSVTDTGPGISKADQVMLFTPFTQVDSSSTRKVGGSGLGLSISRMLIDLHGGRIGVESEVGQGSTFYFALPVGEAETGESEVGESETCESKTGVFEMGESQTRPDMQSAPRDRLILAVDDDRQVISLYERYLRPHGYEIVPVTDPAQALEQARLVRPFAITLDIMMPGIDGWQVLEMLKSDSVVSKIPVIICSIVEDQSRGFNLGAVASLAKPILENDLVSALSGLKLEGEVHKILVVDDNKEDLQWVSQILGGVRYGRRHGRRPGAENRDNPVRWEVIPALGGPEGLAALQSHHPQVVILDLFMPASAGFDGFTFLESMRSDPVYQDIPVIVFTGGDLTDEQKNRLTEFTQNLLSKSTYREDEMIASIERALQRFHGRV